MTGKEKEDLFNKIERIEAMLYILLKDSDTVNNSPYSIGAIIEKELED